jgi:hypothetical protein
MPHRIRQKLRYIWTRISSEDKISPTGVHQLERIQTLTEMTQLASGHGKYDVKARGHLRLFTK